MTSGVGDVSTARASSYTIAADSAKCGPGVAQGNGAPMIPIRRSTGAILLFVLAALLPRPVFAASATSAQRKLDRALLVAVQTHATRPQPVIVRAAPGKLAAVRTWLKAHGALVEAEHPSLNALSTKVSADDLDALANL